MASDLPASIELAWGLRDRPSRGPKRGLTLDQIVQAGVTVAAADGLGALSMGRVAREVGSSTMALYRYVPSKDDLLELMVDHAIGRPAPAPPGETWRDGLRRWAIGVRGAYRAHPWALRVPISAPPLGPNNIRWLENALTALRSTSLSAQERLSTVLLLSGFVRSSELLVLDFTTRVAASGARPEDYVAQLRQLVSERDFPEVSAAMNAGALEDEDDDEYEFEFGLSRLLDGVAALMHAQRAD